MSTGVGCPLTSWGVTDTCELGPSTSWSAASSVFFASAAKSTCERSWDLP